MAVEVWAQDSNYKGLRMIRFERIGEDTGWFLAGKLRWIGPLDGPDEDKHIYSQIELEENKWVRME